MHLLLVDGSGYVFRAFHALPQLTRKTDGLPVGCVAGFCNMLWKLQEDLKGDDAPTHMAVVFDHSAKTFRDDIYPEYKTHRPPPPEELVPQFPLTRTATRAYGIPSIEMEGWEADDIIATCACMARDAGGKVTIVSSDKDLMQLVEPNGSIRLLDTIPRAGQPPLRWIGMDEVQDKFGVTPDKVVDVQALCGDAVDNVPGVPGIGVKTAAELINTFGDIETLLASTAQIKQPKRRQALEDNAELARIGKRLGGILEVNPEDWEPDPELAAKLPEPVGFDNAQKAIARKERLAAEGKSTNAAVLHAADVAERIKALPVDTAAYKTIADEAALNDWIREIYAVGRVAIDLETTGLDNQQADLVGIALSTNPGNGGYLPLGHKIGDGMFGSPVDGQLDMRRALELLKPLLEDRSILKIGHNIKFDLGVLYRYGIAVEAIDDTLLLSYVLDGARFNTLSELSAHWLGHAGIPIKDLIGSGKNQKTFAEVGIPEATRYAAEDADLTMRLWTLLKARLPGENMTALYETEERPLTPVLARMEARGITVDRQILSRLSGDFRQRAAAFEAEAYELAGETFNLGSPKQL